MKKLDQSLLKISVSAILIAGFYSCNFDEKKDNETAPPKQIITIKKAVSMFESEKRLKEKVINPMLREFYRDTTFEDTEFAWFSLDEMRQYINYIDAVQKENPEQKISGIRVYFGRYNKQNSKKFINQQSVFLVPTVANAGINSNYENLNHLPFAIMPEKAENPIRGTYTVLESLVLETDDKKRRIENFHENFNKKQEASFSFYKTNLSLNNQLTSLVLNEGELAPPPKRE